MTIDSPLKQLARSATDPTETAPPLLPILTDLLFADKSLGFWHAIKKQMKDLINEEDASRQLAELADPLAAIGDQLRGADEREVAELSLRLINVLKILEANDALFFLPQATAEEKVTHLPLFTPMAVLHLSTLSLLHTLAFNNSIPASAHLRYLCHTTAQYYLTYAQQAVSDAVTWRTNQLNITCTPMRSAMFGGPNLQVTCVDDHTQRTVVDEMCTAYPGTMNPMLQRTVARVNLYEERLHRKASLFWEIQVLDVLSEWNDRKTEMKRTDPPDSVHGILDDALYLIFQDISRSMMGLK
ncbi:hypothetical protein DSLASN_03970 [Desulfoluna limicola]|uniref:Uncharacterized protein n=1 Tax=Desulfoluna limicola TaxID=2810562 RepID=A0ABM7PCI6_9BACT|nr:hypothetical protein [Desulfoluna limicola]BCS94765.1 hypothetical protein DSLASN_03970 [Desulfoluna limicola]